MKKYGLLVCIIIFTVSGMFAQVRVPRELHGEWENHQDGTSTTFGENTISGVRMVRGFLGTTSWVSYEYNVKEVKSITNTITIYYVNIIYPNGYELTYIKEGEEESLILFISIDGKTLWWMGSFYPSAYVQNLPPNFVWFKPDHVW